MLPHRVLVSTVAAASCLFAPQVHATCATGQSADTTVTPSGSTFVYAWGIFNGCAAPDSSGVVRVGPQLSHFYLPFFSDAGISDIVVPEGWVFSIDTPSNLFGLPGAGVIDFAPTTAFGYSFATGFSYTSSYAGVYAPFRTEFYTVDVDGVPTAYYHYVGDPLIPGSPDAVRALGATPPVPEPASLALFGAGLGLLALRRKRKSSR
ncbi:hypothetical protein BH11PSE8_BH11PSE8_07360 [soil metagenome]